MSVHKREAGIYGPMSFPGVGISGTKSLLGVGVSRMVGGYSGGYSSPPWDLVHCYLGLVLVPGTQLRSGQYTSYLPECFLVTKQRKHRSN